MEEITKLTLSDIDNDITIIDDLDLNSLFNFTYNFDILKLTITTLFKNQQNLLKKITKTNEINNEQNKEIESLQNYIKDNYTTKNESKSLKKNLELKLDELNQKITQIDEELVKSN